VNLAGSETNPHVLCGDFNSEVTSPGYQLVLEGYLLDSMIDQLQSLANLQLPDGSVRYRCFNVKNFFFFLLK
jgi:endonuclease/exonuclease/phosphatase family metal-dependent hydrolase